MAFVITEACTDVRDQTCVEVCPVDCIHFEEGKDRILYIDPVECIDCGACVPVCPEDAIYDEPDVPEDQQRFIEINALWYQDPEGARAQVGGSPEPSSGGAQESTATDSDTPEDSSDDVETDSTSPGPAPAVQVEAIEPVMSGVETPQSRLSTTSLITLAGFLVSVLLMTQIPGPRWLLVAGVGLHATVLLLIVPAFAFLLLFVLAEGRTLTGNASAHERPSLTWRELPTDWRRSEESRFHELTQTVGQIAAERFPFPNEQFPNYQTHINVPQPTMALEFTDTAGHKIFPDIIVVEHPGNYPVLIVQVETRETLSREQAERVWALLQTAEAPLNIYVPSGLAAHAKDYARSAGIKHMRLRTWRWGPNGVTVREV